MKKLSCRAMGEECDFVAVGETNQEVMDNMMEHAQDEHPDRWAEMQQMSSEGKDQMMKDAQSKIEDAEDDDYEI